MVKLFLFCLSCLTVYLLEAAPMIDSSIDSSKSSAHFPLTGTITITHEKDEKVDIHSFEMDGKPVNASFVKDVKMSAAGNTVVSIYEFELPGQEAGLYLLPSLSAKIGNATFRSVPSTYTIKEASLTRTKEIAPVEDKSKPIIFRLEASVQGPTMLYPGERTKLFYRISYNRSIDLSRSDLPMIHSEDFQKVGDVQIEDKQLNDVTIQDLTQEVEASKLGKFQFGPSLIEGYAYSLVGGKKVYDPTLLKAEAPVVSIEVKPFPKSLQPLSFTGAIGEIQLEANLITASKMLLGDTLQLQVKVQGASNLAELRFPLLQCQPGFSGFFQISDLPPVAEVKDHSKIFLVELRPLASIVTEVPPIEMASFNPKTNEYLIQHTRSFPLTVSRPPTRDENLNLQPLLFPLPSIGKWPTLPAAKLQMNAPIVNMQIEKKTTTHAGHVALLSLICIALFLLQLFYTARWPKQPKKPTLKSEELLKKAMKTGFQSKEGFHLMEEAIWNRLWEKGYVPSTLHQPEKLSGIKQLATIQSFLFRLQAIQYGMDKNLDPSSFKQEIQTIINDFFQIH